LHDVWNVPRLAATLDEHAGAVRTGAIGPGSGAWLRCGSKLYHKHGGPECGAEGEYKNSTDSVCGSRLSLDKPTNGEAIIDRVVYTRKNKSKPCAEKGLRIGGCRKLKRLRWILLYDEII